MPVEEQENYNAKKITDKDWISFGRWMAVCSGIVLLTLAFHSEKDTLSTLLRVWSGFLGIYFIFVAIRR